MHARLNFVRVCVRVAAHLTVTLQTMNIRVCNLTVMLIGGIRSVYRMVPDGRGRSSCENKVYVLLACDKRLCYEYN